ncbi:MAG: serine/threonine protein kinase [Planctomycetota bacterium]|nr:serine/threonine protein kinase [Planctomycetota bacterium]
MALAFKRGLLSKQQIQNAILAQHEAAKQGLRKSLDEMLVTKGYVTLEQLNELKQQMPGKGATRRFGDYELLSVLGTGGMGTVYKARQVSMERIIALKILHSDLAQDQELLQRFQREARAVAKLNHPNIVVGIDVGQTNGRHFLAMEYIEGESLDRRLERNGGKIAEADALEIVRQIALALHHAHERNYVHRDVKPENVMLTFEGAAKLMDLGLARAMGPQFQPLTKDGLAVGTPHYISPEQAQGVKDLTPGTDLYSLGVVLFQAVSGRLPFESANFPEVMLQHVNDPPPDPRTFNPRVSEPVAKLILKLLEKEPTHRYPSGQALAEDLERILRGEPPKGLNATAVIQAPRGDEPAKRKRRGTGNRLSFE